jgi:murein L,D-transpeptidase YcbB/YkuD
LRITGFLPRPRQGAAAPSAADLDGALRRFQDREGMKVDGIAAPRRETEAELRKAIRRRAVLAARPPRIGPIRFKPLTGG